MKSKFSFCIFRISDFTWNVVFLSVLLKKDKEKNSCDKQNFFLEKSCGWFEKARVTFVWKRKVTQKLRSAMIKRAANGVILMNFVFHKYWKKRHDKTTKRCIVQDESYSEMGENGFQFFITESTIFLLLIFMWIFSKLLATHVFVSCF